MVDLKKTFKSLLGCRLGQFEMYSPRPIADLGQYHQFKRKREGLRFSIVTPVYNQVSFIEQTLLSVVNQGYPLLEYIVMDGGSSDGTWQVVERYQNFISYSESARDSGQANAINRGMEHASGDILAWLNGDDILLPGALAYVAEFFETHPHIDAVYGHRIVINADGQEVGRWVLPPHSDSVMSWVDYVPQETLFWRRCAWDLIGARVDETFDFALDWDMLVRLRDAGTRFARLPRYIGAFRIHSAQKTSSSMATTGIVEMNRIRTRCLGRLPSRFETAIHVAPYLLQHAVLQRMDQWLHLY